MIISGCKTEEQFCPERIKKVYGRLNCKSGRITYRLKYNLSNETAKIQTNVGLI